MCSPSNFSCWFFIYSERLVVVGYTGGLFSGKTNLLWDFVQDMKISIVDLKHGKRKMSSDLAVFSSNKMNNGRQIVEFCQKWECLLSWNKIVATDEVYYPKNPLIVNQSQGIHGHYCV